MLGFAGLFVLGCIGLCCDVLYYAAMCCAVLYYATLFCVVLCMSVLGFLLCFTSLTYVVLYLALLFLRCTLTVPLYLYCSFNFSPQPLL